MALRCGADLLRLGRTVGGRLARIAAKLRAIDDSGAGAPFGRGRKTEAYRLNPPLPAGEVDAFEGGAPPNGVLPGPRGRFTEPPADNVRPRLIPTSGPTRGLMSPAPSATSTATSSCTLA